MVARALALAMLLSCPWQVLWAAEIKAVEIHGGDDAMRRNVRLALSLHDALNEELSEWRLAYLLRVAESEARQALQPFGYYDPVIRVEHTPEDAGPITVTLTFDPGEPVRVRNADLAILGAGSGDAVLQADLAGFVPAPGAIFTHADYETSKTRISRRLTERGYFEAEFSSHRVEVSRAEHVADIDLVWTSGERYTLGPAEFGQTQPVVGDNLLRKLVPWTPGQPYHQRHLDALRRTLRRLDYFSQIEIETPTEAAIDRQLPVRLTLAPAKRTIYTTGVSYGTGSGSGFRLGMERRYINQRGHKLKAELDHTQNRESLTLQYRIPAFAWRSGWYTLAAQGYDENTSYIDTRREEVSVSRSAQYSPLLTLAGTVHVLRERWAWDVNLDGDERPLYRRVHYTYPSLRADYADLDDRLFPRRGWLGFLRLRSGVDGLASDASFLQLHARASHFRGLGRNTRLLTRAEAGYTWTSALTDMPPSLRFYAGGDRSIRGYDFREVGPRLLRLRLDTNGEWRQVSFYALGARHVVTGSVELEHYFRGSDWGAAMFVDAGSAFDRTPEWRVGVGLGLRWKSPVGPLRLDIGRGLDHPDSPITLGLGIGVEF